MLRYLIYDIKSQAKFVYICRTVFTSNQMKAAYLIYFIKKTKQKKNPLYCIPQPQPSELFFSL